MKVAILTIHHVPNYGAVMQAYSLKSSIQRLGFDCDVINYQPTAAVEHYKPRGRFPRALISSFQYKRIRKFVDRFVICDNRPALNKAEAVFEQIASYDAVVCGSDQIWNADGFRGCDKSFFLGSSDLPSTKKISFAPSIGSTDPTAYVRNWPQCGQWLKEFDAISVRDAPSQRMVASFGIPAPERVCDPTLLPSALKEFSLGKTNRDLLVVYGAPHAKYAERVSSMAKDHKLKIVSIGSRYKFGDRNYLFADPKEWAALFSRAKIVMTAKFHGVQLAISNGALPFYIGRDDKKAKVWDSLSRFGLEKQWVEHPDDLCGANVESGLAQMDNVSRIKDDFSQMSLGWLESQLS